MKRRALALTMAVLLIAQNAAAVWASDETFYDEGDQILLEEEEEVPEYGEIENSDSVLEDAEEQDYSLEVIDADDEVSDEGVLVLEDDPEVSGEEAVEPEAADVPDETDDDKTADVSAYQEELLEFSAELDADQLNASSENLQGIILDQPVEAVISEEEAEAEKLAYFRFTPEVNGTYVFTSVSQADTYGYLYYISEEERNYMTEDDDRGDEHNFRIEEYLYAGETYDFGVRFYDNIAGSFQVKLTLAEVEENLPAFRVYRHGDSEVYVKPQETTQLSVFVVGEKDGINYQWYKDDDEIPGATGLTYETDPVTGHHNYRFEAWDEYDNTDYCSFDVYVDSELSVFAKCDTNLYIAPYERTTLSVEVSADAAVSYQWYKDDYEIPGATELTYETDPVTGYHNYRFEAWDEYGNTDYCVFDVYVDSKLIVSPKCDRVLYIPLNGRAKLSVEVSCNAAVSYQWYKDGDEIPGATGLTYETDAVIEYHYYMFEAWDEYDNYDCYYFYVYVDNGFKVSWEKEIDVEAGKNATLTVNAKVNTGNIHYQWYNSNDGYESQPIDGATDSSYVYAAKTVPGYEVYSCYVTDDFGNHEWCNFTVYTITNGFNVSWEREVTVEAGDQATLTINATADAGEIHYDWWYGYDEEEDEYIWLDDVIGPTYVTKAVNGYQEYCCIVTDDYGNKKYCWFDVDVKESDIDPCAEGHKEQVLPAKPATCTEKGLSAGKKCSVCGEVLQAQTVIPATGHKWNAGVITKYPTTGTTGVRTYTCTVCGATRTEVIPKLTAKEAEGNANDPTSVAGTEKAIGAVKDSGEPKGSSFASIQLQSKKQSKNSISLSWNKVAGASGYIVYGNRCGSKYKLQRIAKTAKNSFTYSKLKKGTYYKFTVAAYKTVNGKEQVIATSKVIHVATTGGKVTNVKKVTAKVNNKAVKKLTLKTKKSATVKTSTTLQNKPLKLAKHRVIKFESSDPKIATVNAKGKITAKKKGKCIIYAYSQNGTYAKITVT